MFISKDLFFSNTGLNKAMLSMQNSARITLSAGLSITNNVFLILPLYIFTEAILAFRHDLAELE
jgi:hypothetical protein